MKILYIGGGFVGACSAAVSAEFGHDVLVYDLDHERIKRLSSFDTETIESCLFEVGLAELIIKNKENLKFISDYAIAEEFLQEADAVFMCLPTPEKGRETGETDLTFFNGAMERLAEALVKRNEGEQEKHVVIVNKSTVPIDTLENTEKFLTEFGVKNFGVVSNPEFLVEGKAVEGSLHPERVVVGAEKEKDFAVMREVYAHFVDSDEVEYVEVNGREAAAGKLLANFFLFDKVIANFEILGRLCEKKPGLNFENLRKILITDKRIGSWGFQNSVYAGGSCWLKDAYSLAYQFEQNGIDATRVRAALDANYSQRDGFYERVTQEAGGWMNKSVAFLGLAFKQDTNDVRNSPAIEFAKYLIRDNVKEIKAYDPRATEMYKRVVNSDKIKYTASVEEALSGTDVCFVLTDWPEFKSLGDKIKTICPKSYLIADGRRMLAADYKELKKIGFRIIAVGECDK